MVSCKPLLSFWSVILHTKLLFLAFWSRINTRGNWQIFLPLKLKFDSLVHSSSPTIYPPTKRTRTISFSWTYAMPLAFVVWNWFMSSSAIFYVVLGALHPPPQSPKCYCCPWKYSSYVFPLWVLYFPHIFSMQSYLDMALLIGHGDSLKR